MSDWYKFNNHQKQSMLFAVGYQPLKIIVNKTTTFDEIRKIIKIAWRISPSTLRLFLTNGSEISQNELKILKQGQKLYVTLNGSDLDANILFLNYSISDQLSKNLNSITLLGKLKSNQANVILKQIRTRHFTKIEFAEFIQIIQQLKAEKMSKIAQIYEMLILERQGELWLATEFCEGVQLNQLIQQNKKLEKTVLQNLIKQICEVIRSLHQRNIIVKNLKLENIFVIMNDHLTEIKFTDIGYNNIYRIMNSTTQSQFNYCTPEMLHGETFSQASDIWALGIIIYYLHYHQFPFIGKTKSKILQNINELKYDNNNNDVIDCSLKDLLKLIFTSDSESRISIQSILDHSYFQKHRAKTNSFLNSTRKLTTISVSRQNTRQNYRRMTSSQRSDSEENNSSLRRVLKISEHRNESQRYPSLHESIKVIGLLKNKPRYDRKRCISQFNLKDAFSQSNTKEF